MTTGFPTSDYCNKRSAAGGRPGLQRAAIFYAFALLYFDGHNLTGLELSSRRHMLTTLLNDRPGDAIRLSETIEADGESLLRNACAHGLEGIIAKDHQQSLPFRAAAETGSRSNAATARVSRS